jgi:hypothetical protein
MPELIPEYLYLVYDKERTPAVACNSRHATLPEIKTLDEAKLMQNMMISWGIDSTPAGISYVDNA